MAIGHRHAAALAWFVASLGATLGVTLGATGAAAGGPVLLTDQQLDSVTAGGLVMDVGGDATAVGDDTLAEGSIVTRVVDRKKVTIGRGSTTFSATAESQDGLAYATAGTYADVEGADIVITKTRKVSGNGADDAAWSTETSRTRVIAIDIKGLDLRNGPITIDKTKERSTAARPASVQGNQTKLTADVQARGVNTLASVDGSVLTTSGLSTVGASALTGAK